MGLGRRLAKGAGERQKARGVREIVRNSSISEKPVRYFPRRLADWINSARARKVHSLVDKVYKEKNLHLAWEKVKANRGAGGMDGVSLKDFEAQLQEHLKRLHVLDPNRSVD